MMGSVPWTRLGTAWVTPPIPGAVGSVGGQPQAVTDPAHGVDQRRGGRGGPAAPATDARLQPPRPSPGRGAPPPPGGLGAPGYPPGAGTGVGAQPGLRRG